MKNEQIQPNPLTDPLLPVIQAQALIAAVKMGIFDAIGPEGCSLDNAVGKCSLNRQGFQKLLILLCSMGYLDYSGGTYKLTEVSRQTLLPGSPFCLTGWIEFCLLQHQAAAGVEDVIKSGRPFNMRALLSTPENRRIHQRGMADTARPAAPQVAEQIPVKEGALRVLDIGGSHGLYSAALCRKIPSMRADVLELPNIIKEAREIAHAEGTSEYVRHIEGDILTADLKETYDVVFMGNLIHHFSPEQNKSVFQKIAAALNRNGTIAIWDIQETGTEEDIIGASFSLFFYCTSGGVCYSPKEISEWLAEAGFSDIQTRSPTGGATHVLITGRSASP